MYDAVLHFPVLLTTIVAVVVSSMLILKIQNTEQQHEHVKQFTAMIAATTVDMRRSHEEVEDGDNGSGSMKWRMIQYDHDCARRCIQQDYLGPSPIFKSSIESFISLEVSMIASRQKYETMISTIFMTLMSLAILQSALMLNC